MKHLTAFIGCFFFTVCSLAVNAQNLDFAWARSMGGFGTDIANAITVDGAGNSYTTGQFSGTVDFDPGPSIYNLTSAGGPDIFICKLDPSGNFLWAKRMGGTGVDIANAITVDGAGNLYTTGQFNGTADFDPGAGTYNLTSLGNFNIFVSKLDASGNFVWAKQMGGTDSPPGSGDVGDAIGVDLNGNVYTTGGFFSKDADFDPGPGTFILASAGNSDLFISKLDKNGNFLWAKQAGATAGESGNAIFIDANANVYTTGLIGSPTVDFDPGPGVFNLFGDGAFILKLDALGNFVWAKEFKETGFGFLMSYAMKLDVSGNIFITGWFNTSVDFDTGPGTFILTPAITNAADIFISKLDPNGNLLWAKQMSGMATGQTNAAESLDIGTNGNIYTAGIFNATVDFDPGPGIYNMTSLGNEDVFVSTLDASGNFISAKQLGGIALDWGHSIKADAFGNVYVAGTYNATADFDPCPGNYNLTSAGGYDIFVVKFASPSVSITASSTSICSGVSVTFTASPTNPGPTPSYQWQVNGVNRGANSNTFTSNGLNNNDQIKVILTSNATCVPPTTAVSNIITMSVGAAVVPSIAISTTSASICSGTSVTFTATSTNGGNSPTYQWQINGINVGTNSTVFATNTLANNDVVNVIMTSNATCATPAQVSSNAVVMNVSPGGPATVNITSTGSTICVGSNISFTATQNNGGSTPFYQWQVNGNNVGANSATYSTNTLSNGDVIKVIMTSILGCATGSPATSNPITVTVLPPGPASVNISATGSAICSGTSVTFTAAPTNGGSSPSYQWQVNGVNTGTNSSTFTTNVLSNGDVVNVVMTSNLSCATGSPATSNSIVMNVTPSVTPLVNIIASSTAICANTLVSFTATPTNGGSTSSYQWQVNGINVGGNSSSYSTTSLTNGDKVSVIMTSNAICTSPSAATSNTVNMLVSVPVIPSVNITTISTTVCVGSSVTFIASPTNGGTSPSYQWKVNGINAGINSATFTTSALQNLDVVTIVMTSNAACATINSATSNAITISVINNIVTPSLSIAVSPGNICNGTTVTFTATPLNGGSSPSYQWKVNGINVGTNSASYTTTILSNGNIVSCLITSNALCASPNTITSNNITITIDPALCPEGFYMPNAFTPNNDGKNDVCKPVLFGNVVSYKFTIYNRWGQKIFVTTDLQKGWDGKVSGIEMDANVFVWFCTFQFGGKIAENRKGTVVLIR